MTFLFVLVGGLWHVKCVSLLEQELRGELRRQVRENLRAIPPSALEDTTNPLDTDDWPKIEIDLVSNVVSIDLYDDETRESGAVIGAVAEWVIGKERYEATWASFHNDVFPNLNSRLEPWVRQNVDVYAMLFPYKVEWQ